MSKRKATSEDYPLESAGQLFFINGVGPVSKGSIKTNVTWDTEYNRWIKNLHDTKQQDDK